MEANSSSEANLGAIIDDVRAQLQSQLLVVFDVDGTLSNSHDLCLQATNHVLTEAGHPPVSPAQYQQGTIYSTPARMAWHATGDAGDASEIGIALGQSFDELYVALVTSTTAPLYDGMRGVLDSLADQTCATPKIAIGALTNAAQAYAVAVLQANELSDMFVVVHGADSVALPKPSPDGLQLCAKEAGVATERVLYVGDSPTDGAAARAAGARGVGVTWGYHTASVLESEFDVLVHTPHALHTEINRWAAASATVHVGYTSSR